MDVCSWCLAEMTTAKSCTVEAFHRDGRRVDLIPCGCERGWPRTSNTCGDCGVARSGWRHPGCDLQRCPACSGQMLSCGCRVDEDDEGADDDLGACTERAVPFGVDGSGALTEATSIAGVKVILHYGDVPESDIVTVDGIRCTTRYVPSSILPVKANPATSR
jgi:hypothetical protein